MPSINAHDVVQALSSAGHHVEVNHTGGNTWTVFAGPVVPVNYGTDERPETFDEPAVAMGPCYRDASGAVVIDMGECYIGPNDNGESGKYTQLSETDGVDEIVTTFTTWIERHRAAHN